MVTTPARTLLYPPQGVDILDIYIAEVSSAHNVCAKNHYLAIVSTIVETNNPQMEIKPGLDLLGPILDKCAT